MGADDKARASHAAFDLLPVTRTADQTHDYIYDQGFLCEGCGHRHVGREHEQIAFVCVWCECAHRAVTVAEFDRMRRVRFCSPHSLIEVFDRRPPTTPESNRQH